jgi:hypothetical protein
MLAAFVVQLMHVNGSLPYGSDACMPATRLVLTAASLPGDSQRESLLFL